MCFSGTQSAFFAFLCFGLAGLIVYLGRPKRMALPVAYFGLMELLQTVQYMYVARPEDGYSMCESPMNQYLSVAGLVHIAFQPFFCNMAITGWRRRDSIQTRFQNDIVLRMSFVFGVSLVARYVIAMMWPENPDLAPRPTADCPNYEWIREGYDVGTGEDTPNLPGHSCTFIPNTPTGHLAWAFPFYQATYFMPGVSVHAFMMFVPSLVIMKHTLCTTILVLSGPVLAAYLTASMNEQAAIWCFYSAYQGLAFCIAELTVTHYIPRPLQEKIVHPGGFGEEPMEYQLVQHASNGKHSNGTNGVMNGKAKHS